MSEHADRVAARLVEADDAWHASADEGRPWFLSSKHAWTSGYIWGYEVAAREAARGQAPEPLADMSLPEEDY